MLQTERREICHLRCIINSGKLEFTWSIITPSTWDWIGLYEDGSKSNKEWLNGHWFYISNHSNRSTLPDGRYVYSGNHYIGTVSGMNQIRLNTYEAYGEYQTYSYANVYNPVFIYFDENRVNYTLKGNIFLIDIKIIGGLPKMTIGIVKTRRNFREPLKSLFTEI